jgi:hypothetical protein
MPSRWVVALALAAAFAWVGPMLTGPRDKPAGEPFVYQPPPGFLKVGEAEKKRIAAQAIEVWAHAMDVTVVQTHTPTKSALSGREIAGLSEGMRVVFAGTCTSWQHVGHESRPLPSGARVGIVEGDCTKPEQPFRTLQLAFPVDDGTAIVTALFPSKDEKRWMPLFDKSIVTAKGLAVRGTSAPGWMHVVWGAGVFFVVMIGSALVRKRS